VADDLSSGRLDSVRDRLLEKEKGILIDRIDSIDAENYVIQSNNRQEGS
jgi:hypothetical protein